MAQRLRGPPVRPKPVQRVRIVRAAPEDSIRHRHKGVQVERAGLAMANQRDRKSMAARSGGAQLASQDPRAGETEAAGAGTQRARTRRRCDQQMEQIFFHPVEVEMPRDGSGATSGGPETDQIGRRPRDQQSMMEPVGVVQPQR